MGIPQPGIPNFVPALVLPDIFNCSNCEYSTFSGLKVDSQRRKRKREKKGKKKKKNSIRVKVNEHNQKRTVDSALKNTNHFPSKSVLTEI